ncbi:MAG: hypothetical protein PHI35_07255 [Victivallaceae bacterium]|nr:hypothetical protein [Victivallaceae bacterium]
MRCHYLKPEAVTVESGRTALTLEWNVFCDVPQSVGTVRRLSGVPVLGDVCPVASNLYASRITVKPFDAKAWRFSVEYDTGNVYESVRNIAAERRPWNAAPTVEYQRAEERVVCEKYLCSSGGAVSERPILNPAGDPYNTPPEVVRAYYTIIIKWAVRSFLGEVVNDLEGTVNAGGVVIDEYSYAPRELQLLTLTPTKVKTDDGVEYYELAAEICFKYWGHDYKPLAMGFNAFDETGKKRAVLIDSGGKYNFTSGTRITDPVLLGSDGKLLTSDAAQMPAMEGFFQTFEYLPSADWSSLKIPAIKAWVVK